MMDTDDIPPSILRKLRHKERPLLVRAFWPTLAIVALAAAAAYLFYRKQSAEPEPVPPPPLVRAPEPAASPQIRFPIPSSAPVKALPELDDSDPAVLDALRGMWRVPLLQRLLHMKEFIRSAVATIDNLPRRKLTQRMLPVKPAEGAFVAAADGQAFAIDPDNAARYAIYVRLAAATDARQLVAIYVHFYPLFQLAYQDLGYPQGYFNDRLVEAIDDLLDAPDLKGPVALVRPKFFYEFADRDLEARSAGQRILMRIGDQNAAIVKTKLREIRAELTREGPKHP